MKLKSFLLVTFLTTTVGACSSATGTKMAMEELRETSKSEEGVQEKAEEQIAPAQKFDSPTAAITAFVEGVKTENVGTIKSALSSATVKYFELTAKSVNKSFYETLTMEDGEEMKKLPEIRNQKINGDKATLEVKDDKKGVWEKIPFVKEDGGWKMSFFTEEDLKAVEKDLK